MLSDGKNKIVSIGSVGPEVIIGVPKGDFLGEVTSASFITGGQLGAGIGLYAGTSVADTGWLKFADSVDGRTKYISKKPLRSHISWDSLHAVGAVWGTVTVVIQGNTYKVRLLSGSNYSQTDGAEYTFDHPRTHGCEWNRLLYHISAKPFGTGSNTLASEGIEEGDWASYSEADIGMALAYLSGAAGDGSYQWCQETGTTPTRRVFRGAIGVSYLGAAGSADTGNYLGWRPVLELVS